MSKAMDSLDLVEAVMLIEEVLETEIPDGDAKHSAVRERWWTSLNFTFQTNGPTNRPLLCLENWPRRTTTLRLAEGLEGTWRREQIAATVRDIFRQ